MHATRLASAVALFLCCKQRLVPRLGRHVRAGILLAVTIIYQYWEAWEKEKAQGQGFMF
jgi:hypothetical protein